LHRRADSVIDVRRDARCASASERTHDMTEMRRCIGSERFGIEAHEAPVTEFPAQPSQKDGLGRMCKPHWNAYTNALRKAALARKAAEACPFAGTTAEECSMIRERSVAGVSDDVPDCPVHGVFRDVEPEPAPEPTKARRGRKAAPKAEATAG
jgi:hypothetical protein